MIPPRSPHGLIQEDLYPDEWKCIVACIMLNCTTRKQAEKILPEFFNRWPNPHSYISADPKEVINLISPLGFGTRRTQRLFDMSNYYVKKNWKHARELPGVGEYASRMWEIFFKNKLGDNPPNDGSLAKYWLWRKKLGL